MAQAMRLFLWMVVMGAVIAQPVSAASPSANAATPQQAFVYQVAGEVLNSVRAAPTQTDAKQVLESVFTRYVDIEWVGQFVLGRHWRTANPDQKQRFIAAYRSFMAEGYTSRLREYSGDDYTVSAPRNAGNGRYALTMKVKRPQGEPVIIDYKIRDSASSYKIYDLVVEGISLITTQRSEFDSVVGQHGIDFLIEALKKKTAAR
jgi:phospholipid transport system substrate-binding protein